MRSSASGRGFAVGALCAALCVASTLPAAAQGTAAAGATPDRRVMTAERLLDGERLKLDGVLDEPFWVRAAPATDFIQQEPALGEKPTERTEVRIAFDSDRLYMGVLCFDSEPKKLLGNTRKRDEFLSADDRFMWTMDTFLNEQTGYFFEMNPSGLMADALMGPGGSSSREWDGVWNARVKRSDIGWTIELEIPFRSLAFDPNAEAWGVNFQRTVRRKNEESLWMGYQRNQGLRRMSNAGRLTGLKGLSRGRGLEIKPYLAGATGTAPGGGATRADETSGDIGLDLAYNLTPSLRAVATINTDFAETEVDQRRLNLTRFPLQFPEKRAFFLDGATFFDFPATAFFSRRIGLDDAGQPQPVRGGAKLTGQAGRFDIGALWVRTGAQDAARAEDFLVGRVRRRILRQSYIGALYTGRSTRDSGLDMRHTVALDARLATSTFTGRRNLEATAFFMRTTPAPGTASGSLWMGARLAYPNDIWDASLHVQEQQRNVAPAVGFLQRTAFRRYSPQFKWNPRPTANPVVRRLTVGGEADFYTDLANRLVTREVRLTPVRVETHRQDSVEANIIPTYERLEKNFTISSGVVLPAGSEYRFTRYRLSAATANRRVLSFRPRVEWGGFFSGTRRETVMEMGIRPRPGVTVNLSTEWNTVRLREGAFKTRLHRMVADTQFSPFMYLVNTVQYDSVSRVLGFQARFRWIVKPGNDVFFVYTRNWIDRADEAQASSWQTLDRRAAAKVSYTKRF